MPGLAPHDSAAWTAKIRARISLTLGDMFCFLGAKVGDACAENFRVVKGIREVLLWHVPIACVMLMRMTTTTQCSIKLHLIFRLSTPPPCVTRSKTINYQRPQLHRTLSSSPGCTRWSKRLLKRLAAGLYIQAL